MNKLTVWMPAKSHGFLHLFLFREESLEFVLGGDHIIDHVLLYSSFILETNFA